MEFDIPSERLIGGDTALVTFTTSGYADFVRNLDHSLRRSDPRLAESLTVFCADAAAAEALRPGGMFTIDCGATGLPEFAEFEGSGFGRVVRYKFVLARRLLRPGAVRLVVRRRHRRPGPAGRAHAVADAGRRLRSAHAARVAQGRVQHGVLDRPAIRGGRRDAGRDGPVHGWGRRGRPGVFQRVPGQPARSAHLRPGS
jgi:hypothetical protein